MTVDTFVTIISTEVEKLQQQEKELTNKVQFLEKTGATPKEIEAAKYELSVVVKKLYRIRNLVGIEAVARIRSMSDVELEAYKKDQVEYHELLIVRIKSEIASQEAEKKELNEELEELAKKGDLSEEAVKKGKLLREKLTDLEISIVDTKARLELEERVLQEMKEWTLERVRADLMPQNAPNQNIDDLIQIGQADLGVAEIGEDYEKAEKLAGLRRSYLYQQSELRQAGIQRTYIINKLPKTIQSLLADTLGDKSDISTFCIKVSDPKRLIELLNKARAFFNEQKRIFEEEYTLENLEPLVGKNNINNITADVDFEYLEKYEELIGKDSLEQLRSFVKERDLLSRKLFKTSRVKSDIAVLDSDIRMCQFKMYEKIIKYYESKFNFNYFKGDFIYERSLDFSSKKNLVSSLESIAAIVEQVEQEYDNIQEEALKHQQALDEKKKEISEKMENIVQQIKELTGREEKYVYSGQNQLDNIANETSLGYQTQVLQTVKEEAQKQSDEKEAELRSITLAQLYEMRKQLTEQKQEEPVQEEPIQEVEEDKPMSM